MPSKEEQMRDNAARGYSKACQSPAGLLLSDAAEVLSNYHRLRTDEARAAFADRWLTMIAGRLDTTWPVIYDLLKLVRERELFREPGFLKDHSRTYASFEDYFTARLGQPFDRWAELEATYHFVATCKPELFGATLTEATSAAQTRAQAVAQAAQATTGEVLPEGRPGKGTKQLANLASYQSGRAAASGISLATQKKLDALARKAPALLEDVRAGKKSAHRACVEAGLVKERTALEWLQWAWKRATPAEREAFRAEIGL